MKRGFTLLELLATIIIVAFIAVITVPIVISSIETSKKSAFKGSIEGIIRVVDNESPVVTPFTRSLTLTDGVLTNDSDSSVLVYNGTLEGNGVIEVDASGKVALVIGTTSYCARKDFNEIEAIVTDGPCSDYVIGGIITPPPSGIAPDTSGANAPVLDTGMIRVIRDEANTKWIKKETNNGWYNYGEKIWANAVIVTPASRAAYLAAPADTEILEDDILLYMVWIPRYKFAIPTGSGPREISVVFETGTATTGTGDGNGTNYLTHPSFTFNGHGLQGVWVAKFETGKKQAGEVGTWTTAGAQGGSTPNAVLSKPNIYSWRSNNVSVEYALARAVKSDTDYGITTDNFDTHMSNNLEWGMVSFLSHSIYGVNGEVWINPANNYMTGCAGDSASSAATTGCLNAYHTTNGVKASTTGNIYGIYDMSGGAYEHTMAHWTNYAGSSGFSTAFLSGAEAALYINKYGSGTVFIGDAGKGTPTAGWYSDEGSAMIMNLFNAWYRRGGSYSSGSAAGMFTYNSAGGGAETLMTFRLMMVED